jgi:hypothetical protein
MRWLKFQNLTVSKLKNLCDNSQGTFEKSGKLITLERKLAQFSESRLLFRYAIRGCLRFWLVVTDIPCGHLDRGSRSD